MPVAKRLKWGNVEIGYVSGLVSTDEGLLLAELASRVPADQAIVEIGSQGGTSTSWLGMGVHKGGNHAPIYAIDLWDDPDLLGRQPKHADAAVLARFMAQIEYCASAGFLTSADVIPVKGESIAEAAKWSGPIGLLHVDALHTYAACAADIDAWAPFVVPGGYIVVHDYHDRRFGVRKAVTERLTRAQGWEFVEAPRWSRRPRRRGQFVARKL